MPVFRNASTVWKGNLVEGSGETTFESSGLGTHPVTWKARSEAAEGKTSPEELIAAAHSACFSMAFSNELASAGYTATEIKTSSEVGFQPGEGITGSKLTLVATIPGISEDEFQKIANDAKEGCPVSVALNSISITLEATLNN